MNKFVMTAFTAAALVVGPMAASAQSIAAALSATFGADSVDGQLEGPGGITSVQSVSVAGAVGDFAVASAVANAASSGAAAGSTSDTDFTPVADVSSNGGLYETNVAYFPTDFEGIVSATQAAVCEEGFTGSGPIFIDRSDNDNTITGDLAPIALSCGIPAID